MLTSAKNEEGSIKNYCHNLGSPHFYCYLIVANPITAPTRILRKNYYLNISLVLSYFACSPFATAFKSQVYGPSANIEILH